MHEPETGTTVGTGPRSSAPAPAASTRTGYARAKSTRTFAETLRDSADASGTTKVHEQLMRTSIYTLIRQS